MKTVRTNDTHSSLVQSVYYAKPLGEGLLYAEGMCGGPVGPNIVAAIWNIPDDKFGSTEFCITPVHEFPHEAELVFKKLGNTRPQLRLKIGAHATSGAVRGSLVIAGSDYIGLTCADSVAMMMGYGTIHSRTGNTVYHFGKGGAIYIDAVLSDIRNGPSIRREWRRPLGTVYCFHTGIRVISDNHLLVSGSDFPTETEIRVMSDGCWEVV